MDILLFKSAGQIMKECIDHIKKSDDSVRIDVLLTGVSQQIVSPEWQKDIEKTYRLAGKKFKIENLPEKLKKKLYGKYDAIIIPAYNRESYFEVERLARKLNSKKVMFYFPESKLTASSKLKYYQNKIRHKLNDLFGRKKTRKKLKTVRVGKYEADFSIEKEIASKRLKSPWINRSIRESLGLRAVIDCFSGGTFFDVGAHLGLYSAFLGAKYPEIEVHCFEVSPNLIELIEENLNLNGIESYFLVNAAVADCSGEIINLFPRDGGSESKTQIRSVEAGMDCLSKRVISLALDDYVSSTGSKPGMVKIDVEGAEGRVLKGMDRVLDKERPLIIIEYHPGLVERYSDTAEQIVDFLRSKEYSLFRLREDSNNGDFSYVEVLDANLGHEMLLCRPN